MTRIIYNKKIKLMVVLFVAASGGPRVEGVWQPVWVAGTSQDPHPHWPGPRAVEDVTPVFFLGADSVLANLSQPQLRSEVQL